eukprot:4517706-Pyramimonas_sp.AAC.1
MRYSLWPTCCKISTTAHQGCELVTIMPQVRDCGLVPGLVPPDYLLALTYPGPTTGANGKEVRRQKYCYK